MSIVVEGVLAVVAVTALPVVLLSGLAWWVCRGLKHGDTPAEGNRPAGKAAGPLRGWRFPKLRGDAKRVPLNEDSVVYRDWLRSPRGYDTWVLRQRSE